MSSLEFRQDMIGHDGGELAYAKMVHAIFGIASPGRLDGALAPRWTAMAYFDDQGRCVAGLEVAALSLLSDGDLVHAGGIRRVGVMASWRGHGLFRALMERAITWSQAQCIALMLLYAEEPDLYRRFGFESVAQHAFAGNAPLAATTEPARILDIRLDRQLVGRLLACRAPVSDQIAVIDAPGLFLERLSAAETTLAYLPDVEVLIVYETDGDALTLVDCAATVMPSMARIIGALAPPIARVTTLFPPDLLSWDARPVVDDTGLMARGALPPSMQRPFMLPPTTEF